MEDSDDDVSSPVNTHRFTNTDDEEEENSGSPDTHAHVRAHAHARTTHPAAPLPKGTIVEAKTRTLVTLTTQQAKEMYALFTLLDKTVVSGDLVFTKEGIQLHVLSSQHAATFAVVVQLNASAFSEYSFVGDKLIVPVTFKFLCANLPNVTATCLLTMSVKEQAEERFVELALLNEATRVTQIARVTVAGTDQFDTDRRFLGDVADMQVTVNSDVFHAMIGSHLSSSSSETLQVSGYVGDEDSLLFCVSQNTGGVLFNCISNEAVGPRAVPVLVVQGKTANCKAQYPLRLIHEFCKFTQMSTTCTISIRATDNNIDDDDDNDVTSFGGTRMSIKCDVGTLGTITIIIGDVAPRVGGLRELDIRQLVQMRDDYNKQLQAIDGMATGSHVVRVPLSQSQPSSASVEESSNPRKRKKAGRSTSSTATKKSGTSKDARHDNDDGDDVIDDDDGDDGDYTIPIKKPKSSKSKKKNKKPLKRLKRVVDSDGDDDDDGGADDM